METKIWGLALSFRQLIPFQGMNKFEAPFPAYEFNEHGKFTIYPCVSTALFFYFLKSIL